MAELLARRPELLLQPPTANPHCAAVSSSSKSSSRSKSSGSSRSDCGGGELAEPGGSTAPGPRLIGVRVNPQVWRRVCITRGVCLVYSPVLCAPMHCSLACCPSYPPLLQLLNPSNNLASIQVGEGSIAALSTGGTVSKFGVPLREARPQLLAAFRRHAWLNALHLHVGSQVTRCAIDVCCRTLHVYELESEAARALPTTTWRTCLVARTRDTERMLLALTHVFLCACARVCVFGTGRAAGADGGGRGGGGGAGRRHRGAGAANPCTSYVPHTPALLALGRTPRKPPSLERAVG